MTYFTLSKEADALHFLSMIPGLGIKRIQLLIQHYGSAAAALEGEVAEVGIVAKLPSFESKKLELLRSGRSLKELELAQKNGIQLLAYDDPLFPKEKLDILGDDTPLLLYIKGETNSLREPGVAIIGTRACSMYGKEMAEKLGYDLAGSSVVVISGLARGIDTFAHVGALKSGKTVGVLGSGLLNMYPKENGKLAERIADGGCVVSELPPLTAPEAFQFPRRNRIVAALSQVIILIEAPLKSGAMITCEMGEKMKKNILAISGPIDLPSFRGNHLLIKERRAFLVENSEDVLSHMDFVKPNFPRVIESSSQKITCLFSPEEEKLLLLMPSGEVSFENLIELSGLTAGKLTVLLIKLRMKKEILEYPGKRYKKVLHG